MVKETLQLLGIDIMSATEVARHIESLRKMVLGRQKEWFCDSSDRKAPIRLGRFLWYEGRSIPRGG
jgi:hypothetical protein